jgi:hypothetical protein
MPEINPSKILPNISGAKSVDKEGDIRTKYFEVTFPLRSLNKDTLGLLSDKPSVTLSLGEFVAFRTFGGKIEIPNGQSITKMSDKEKRESLLYHFGIFLYGDAKNSSLQKIAIIELKNYYMQLRSTYDNKIITLSEGKTFVRDYIVDSLVTSGEEMLNISLNENFNVFGKEKVKFLKDNFKNPVLSTYKRFEKTFLPENPTNTKIAHFKEFRTFYNIKNIRNIKKVVELDEIEARMSSLNDESNDKRFN